LGAELEREPAGAERLASRALPLGPAAVARATALATLLAQLHVDAAGKPPAAVLDLALSRTGYLEWLTGRPDGREWATGLDTLRALAARAQGDLAAWLAELQLEETAGAGAEDGGRVTLTTIHGAKGAEWPAVFLIGLEEGLLPHARALVGGADAAAPVGPPGPGAGGARPALEEELRVAFVAVTRPQTTLYLTHCRERWQDGYRSARRPSRFLLALPDPLTERAGNSVNGRGTRPVRSA
jgi:DNA helicase-2/ATP-dependent DNA helicase PcrA